MLGILADDGVRKKTLQTITISAHLKKNESCFVIRSLILIGGMSLKFAPQLDVAVSYGLKPEDVVTSLLKDHQIVYKLHFLPVRILVYKAGKNMTISFSMRLRS